MRLRTKKKIKNNQFVQISERIVAKDFAPHTLRSPDQLLRRPYSEDEVQTSNPLNLEEETVTMSRFLAMVVPKKSRPKTYWKTAERRSRARKHADR